MIHVFVPGTPVPQGSVELWRGRIVGVKPELKAWRTAIRKATLERHHGEPLDGPITVSLVFQLAPPKRPRWPLPAVKPDLDKLTRAVFDSLSTTKHKKTSTTIPGVIVDDARITSFHATKTYHGKPGVLITITKEAA
ncbi:RusA-like Holliday junction resolvase [Arthrobacter phage Kumotta]|uniref:RusA-like resolvase n=2 Tax=Kumottavirus TaxID=3044749 RepID=A0A4Y6EUI6_9CAUD|nr:RusA-like Holliday junction resolvase [Arthrobacter phage Kumotta]YP_010649548.1 RusA-like Holliday junction resolvase [Arthrobacter phage MargaretKali]AXH44446.1 RusA-like resolvase [Arthrobacter phage MargaretKali]QDF19579.1 RusA-like resolvase [Arthrobacter phage Kumotta]